MKMRKVVLTENRKVRRITWWCLGIVCCVSFLRYVYYDVSTSELVGSPNEFHFGSRTLRIEFTGGNALPGWFNHTFQRGDDFRTERVYAIQLPTGALTIELTDEPLDRVRRALPDTTPGLFRVLRSGDPVESYCAAEALTEKGEGEQTLLPRLLEAAERERSIMTFVAGIARTHPTPTLVPPLIRALSTTNAEIRLAVIQVLADLGPLAAPATPRLLACFSKANGFERMAFAYALWRVGADVGSIAPTLHETFSLSSDHAMRCSVLRFLGETRSASPPLIQNVALMLRTNRNTEFLLAGIRLLSRATNHHEIALTCFQSILQRTNLGSSDAGIRLTVINGLGEMDVSAVPLLTDLYRRTNRVEAESAARALVRLLKDSPTGIEVFAPDLSSHIPWRVTLACEVIAQFGPAATPTLPLLRDLTRAQTRPVRVQAGRALAKLEAFPPDLVPPVLDALRDPYPTCTSAAELLTSVARKDADVQSALNRALDENPDLAHLYKKLSSQLAPAD